MYLLSYRGHLYDRVSAHGCLLLSFFLPPSSFHVRACACVCVFPFHLHCLFSAFVVKHRRHAKKKGVDSLFSYCCSCASLERGESPFSTAHRTNVPCSRSSLSFMHVRSFVFVVVAFVLFIGARLLYSVCVSLSLCFLIPAFA